MTDNTFISDAHAKVIKILEKKGVELMEEVDFPPYRVDIYVPDCHAAIEVDGPQHSVREQTTRDTRLLFDYKLPVYHIRVDDIPTPILWLQALQFFLKKNVVDKDKRWEFCAPKTPWL